jgi:hypothetical protein
MCSPLPEVHRDRQRLGRPASAGTGRGKGLDLSKRRLGRRGPRVERLLGPPVPGLEGLAADRIRPARAVEHVRRRAELDIGVDKRTAPTPAAVITTRSRMSLTSNIPPGLARSCQISRGASSSRSGKSALPKRLPRSSRQTVFPASARRHAAMPPPNPDPTTIASYEGFTCAD